MAVVSACLRVYADIRSAFKTFLLTVSFFEGSAAQRVRGYLNIKHNIKKAECGCFRLLREQCQLAIPCTPDSFLCSGCAVHSRDCARERRGACTERCRWGLRLMLPSSCQCSWRLYMSAQAAASGGNGKGQLPLGELRRGTCSSLYRHDRPAARRRIGAGRQLNLRV